MVISFIAFIIVFSIIVLVHETVNHKIPFLGDLHIYFKVLG